MNWTNEQSEAIESRSKNLLVSAAAGSGKTALLIERIRQMVVNENKDVDKLLVLTFTRAAAAEMKMRLRKALTEELEKPESDKLRILNQLTHLSRASISTLHAFCGKVVREYFQEAGIDPEFTMGSESELAIMKDEAINAVFDEAYDALGETEETPFSQLVDLYTGNRNDDALKAMVLKCQTFLNSIPNAETWSQQKLADLDMTEEAYNKSIYHAIIQAEQQDQINAAALFVEMALKNCTEDFKKAADQLEEDAQKIAHLSTFLNQGKPLRAVHFKDILAKRYSGNAKADKETNELIKAFRNKAKDALKSANALVFPKEEGLALLQKMQEPLENFYALTQKFDQKFKEKKRERNILDFNDLEQLTLKILQNESIAQEFQNRYEDVFLDEYQDTNEVQEAIVQKIVRKDNYFMVGDVKQSIYGFRQADPSIFLRKYQQFETQKQAENQLITLSQNFRSSRSVIDTVNFVFEPLMTRDFGGIDYDARAKLYKGLSNEGEPVKTEIHLIENKLEELHDDAFKEMAKEEREAYIVANRILALKEEKCYRTRSGVDKEVHFRDIVVLMRSVKTSGEIFASVFSQMGIPVYFEGGDAYYETLEVSIVLNLLKIIDNRRQDIPLLSVMLSPIGGFDSADLSAIREAYKDTRYFYEAVMAYKEEKKDERANKLTAFYEALDAWHQDSLLMDIESFLWKLYLETDYYYFVRALPGGEIRQNNLRVLLKRAGDYKSSTLKGVYHFIDYIQKMKDKGKAEPVPGILSDQDDVVRIMTIHKSKGLEFPIVFLSGAGKQFNLRSEGQGIVFHKDLGFCPEYIDVEARIKTDTPFTKAYQLQTTLEQKAEEMRILYVGMTRAEERLIITGGVKDFEKMRAEWQMSSEMYVMKKARNQFDWIMRTYFAKPFNTIFELNVHKGDIPILKNTEEKQEVAVETNQKQKDWIAHCLSYEIISEEKPVPAKMSVTELKGFTEEKTYSDLPERMAKPAFMSAEEKNFTAAEKGTAFHFFMQHIHLKHYRNISKEKCLLQLQAEKKAFVEAELMEETLINTVNLKQVESFLFSSLGQRLLQAEKVYRERPFNLAYDPGRILKKWESVSQTTIIQGMLDCYFLEGDEFVLLDYKTDGFKELEWEEKAKEKYRNQLEIYAEALEKITGKGVKSKILCMITMGKNIIL